MASRAGTTSLSTTSDDRTQQRSTQNNDQDNGSYGDLGDEVEDEDIICAIDRRGQNLGCSVYCDAEQKLSLMEDIIFPESECISTRMSLSHHCIF